MRHSQCRHNLLPGSPHVAPPAASAFPVGISPCVRSAWQTAGGAFCGRRFVFSSCGGSCGSYAILEHVASPYVCVTQIHIGRLAGGGVGSLNVPRLGFIQTNQTTWLQNFASRSMSKCVPELCKCAKCSAAGHRCPSSSYLLLL